MSMFFGPASTDPAGGGLPRGEVLGTYDSYAEARTVLDRLAEAEFDVRTVSIVGTDLRTVERIRNRLTYASVALRSALQGAFFGLLLGILMSLVDPSGSGLEILYTVGLGVGIWVLLGVIGHAVRKGKGFDSVQQLVPTRFDVVCAFETASRAREVLGGAAATTPQPVAPHVPVPPRQQAGGPAVPPSGSPVPPAGPAAPPQGPTPAPAPAPEASPSAGAGSAGPGPTAAGPSGAGSTATGAAGAATPAGSGSRVAGAAGGQGQAGTGAAGTGAADGGPTGPEAGGGAAPRSGRSHDLPDLPDGRPQYGIRLPEAEARAVRERILRGQRAGTAPGAGTFAAPDYGRGGHGRRSDPHRPVDGGSAPGGEPVAGEETSLGEGPASGPERERFRRPRYGRRAARSGTDAAGGPGTPEDTAPDRPERPAGDPPRDGSA